MIEKTIVQLMPETLTDQFDFKGVYVDAKGISHSLTVYDTEYFYLNALSQYASRKVMVPEEGAEAFFLRLYNSWVNSRKDLYLKQAYAYTLKYNPIENYNSTEEMIDDITTHEKGASYKDDYNNTDTNTLTPFTSKKVETTPAEVKTETTPMEDVVTTTPYTKENKTTTPHDATTTEMVSGFNSQNFANAAKSVASGYTDEEYKKTGNETVTTTHNNTKETVHTTSNNTKEKIETTYVGTEENKLEHTGYIEHTTDGEDTDTRNYTLKKSGNIGVMTPAEMLQKEFDGLIQDLAKRAMFEFIDRYTYYSEEVS